MMRVPNEVRRFVRRHGYRPWCGPKEPPADVVEPCGSCGEPRAVHPTYWATAIGSRDQQVLGRFLQDLIEADDEGATP